MFHALLSLRLDFFSTSQLTAKKAPAGDAFDADAAEQRRMDVAQEVKAIREGLASPRLQPQGIIAKL